MPKMTRSAQTARPAVVCSLTNLIQKSEPLPHVLTLGDFVPIAKLRFRNAFDETFYSDDSHVSQTLLKAYFSTQHRLDTIFDAGNGRAYIEARNTLYPECGNGSRRNQLNRASDKLIQLDDAVPFVGSTSTISTRTQALCVATRRLVFADICSAPGDGLTPYWSASP